ncbi:unnamed protein product, partial [Brachionus calyciflorus]
MVYEDTYRIRQLNDLKVQHEINSINVLKKCLNESKEQTHKMTNLLDNFESRLSALHDIIVPVYDSTNILQIKHSNLQTAVNQLDNILEYYKTVENLSANIQAGPGQDISSYLSQMDKLKGAIQYFAVNKNQSQKAENEELWNKGKINVDREFETFLGKFSDLSIKKLNMNDSLNDQTDSSSNYGSKEYAMNQMICIIEWFKKTEQTHLDKLYDKIIKCRSQIMLDNIKKTKSRNNSLGNNNVSNSISLNTNNSNSSSQYSKRSSLAPLSPVSSNLSSPLSENDSRRVTLRSRLTENLFSSSDIRKKTPKSNLNDSYSNSSVQLKNMANLYQIDEEHEINECLKFNEIVLKTLSMFQLEVKFIYKLLESDNFIATRVLERIFDPVLRLLHVETERLSSNVKHIQKKTTSKYIVSLLSILSEMVKTKPQFLKIFQESTFKSTKTMRHLDKSTQLYLEIFVNIEKACVEYLRDVADSTKNDSEAIHPNGNIHPITTETLSFINNLLPFDVIAGFISSVVVSENSSQEVPSEVEIKLRRKASEDNAAVFNRIAYQVEKNVEKKVYRISLAEYFYRLLKYLNLNLKKKAENYQDQNLKCIFLLNNTHKINKLLGQVDNLNQMKQQEINEFKNLCELLAMANRLELKNYYETEILNHKREYSKCWSRLIPYIKDLIERNPFNSEKLKDKDRQLLKDRFSGFNKEFEDIYEAQKRYYIPVEQNELADEIRQDNVLYVGSQYQKFYNIYSKINFATNKDKYVKYTPEALNAM